MAGMRLIVSGAAGRMGRMVVRTIHESDGLKLTGALERLDSPWLGADPAALAGCPASSLAIVADPLPLLLEADAIVDFSSPAASVELAGLAAQARIVDVIGTTGLSADDLDRIDAARGVGAGARFRHRDRRDASSDEGRRALGHSAPAWRSGGRGAKRCAQRPFGARPRRPDRRGPQGGHRVCVAARGWRGGPPRGGLGRKGRKPGLYSMADVLGLGDG